MVLLIVGTLTLHPRSPRGVTRHLAFPTPPSLPAALSAELRNSEPLGSWRPAANYSAAASWLHAGSCDRDQIHPYFLHLHSHLHTMDKRCAAPHGDRHMEGGMGVDRDPAPGLALLHILGLARLTQASIKG